MKKLSIFSLTLLSTLLLSGCGGSDNGTISGTSVNTIAAGETKTLTAGTVITSYSGTCTTSIVVETNGDWTVSNTSSNPNDICQYSN